MNRIERDEVTYVDTSANEPLVATVKRVPSKLKRYEKDESGEPISIDGPDKSRLGFPLPWKHPKRPTAQLKADYLAELRKQNGRRTHAAEILEIPLGTLKDWLQNDEGFRLNVQAVQETCNDDVRRIIDDYVHNLKDKEFLKLKAKTLSEYNPTRETKVSVSGTVNHDHAVLKDMSPGDRQQLLRDAAEAIDAEYEEVE